MRLRRLRPREMRSIRHWAIELAVVVVGVLLALGAAEWAEGRREAARQAEALEEVDAAIDNALLFHAHYQATKPCILAERDRILEQLRAPGTAWQGIAASNSRQGLSSQLAFDYPFLPMTAQFRIDAWDRARAVGAFETMDRDRADQYALAEYSLDIASRQADILAQTLATFAPLSVDRTLTADQRLAMEQALAQADLSLEFVEVLGISLRQALREIDWVMGENLRRANERAIETRRGQFGACIVDVDPFPPSEKTLGR